MRPPRVQERRERKTGLLLGGAAFLVFAGMTFLVETQPKGIFLGMLLAIGVGVGAHFWATRKSRHRAGVRKQLFPAKWKSILGSEVGFYLTLSPKDQLRFEDMLMLFLDEVRITGIKTQVSERIRVLVGASAIIPIFGFEGWDYFNLGEILIFPGPIQNPKDAETPAMNGLVLGRVNSWQNHQVMMLSLPSLERGFQDMKDKQNVGIHEFAHVIDHADGVIDGVPALMLPPDLVEPWKRLMYREIDKIAQGKSRLRPYGATNEAEFFAVATEYFFEHPEDLEDDHPELYAMLRKIFRQDTSGTYAGFNFGRLLHPYGHRIGRNDRCPCGSGEKYKKCCLE